MTPAGTISPSRVFVIGVGIASSGYRYGEAIEARVEAFDTRPVVEEQVRRWEPSSLKLIWAIPDKRIKAMRRS